MSRLRPEEALDAIRHAEGRALPLRVGTRGSPLALWQARHVLSVIGGLCPAMDGAAAFEECVIATAGDQILDKRLADIGGKGLFAKEIHEALLDRRIDCAVHSLKDLETEMPPGIVLAAVLPREDPRDAIVLGPVCEPPDCGDPLSCLPQGALIGTASVRRQAQLLHLRPDLRCEVIRGNVQTRLGRVRGGDFAASFLALAGLKRLGMEREAALVLDPTLMVPAAGQGIVGITVRADDTALCDLLGAIACPEATVAATAERALLGALDGSCRTPIGAHARRLPDGQLHLTGLIARADGSFVLKREATGDAADARRLGEALGDELRAHSPADILQ